MYTDKINQIIKETSPIGGKINKNSKLKDDLGIDSMRLVELLVTLEEEFSIEFPLSDLNVRKFSVVNDIYKLVNKYMG